MGLLAWPGLALGHTTGLAWPCGLALGHTTGLMDWPWDTRPALWTGLLPGLAWPCGLAFCLAWPGLVDWPSGLMAWPGTQWPFLAVPGLSWPGTHDWPCGLAWPGLWASWPGHCPD